MATSGFEQVELELPQNKLTEMGATVHLISDEPVLKSWHQKKWKKDFRIDKELKDTNYEYSDYRNKHRCRKWFS